MRRRCRSTLCMQREARMESNFRGKPNRELGQDLKSAVGRLSAHIFGVNCTRGVNISRVRQSRQFVDNAVEEDPLDS